MKLDFNIVTIHKAKNYGAVLQAYALKKHLSDIGYNAAVYDSVQIEAEKANSLRHKVIRLGLKSAYFFHKRDLDSQKRKFNAFVDAHFDLNKSRNASVYLAGSDQIWNPIVFNPDYFLNFVGENSIKASYAASIGVSQIPKDKYDLYRNNLYNFDALSVREADAQTELLKILGDQSDIRVDPDPVFLLNKQEWMKAAESSDIRLNEEYVLLYILHVPKNLNALCKWAKKELGADLVLIDASGHLAPRVVHDKVLRNVGPCEFLSLIEGAKAVITTSFHGTAFSILFGKEVYSVVNASFPSRITNVLKTFDIEPVLDSDMTFHRITYSPEETEKVIDERRRSSDLYFDKLIAMAREKNGQRK